ncbi:MAG: response regulator [Acidobacteriaceae bacterium]
MMRDSKPKILIVDDNASIRMCLSQLFMRAGLDVRSARDGFSALSEIHLQEPDILLSDLNMPGMSGFELLSTVRRDFPMIRAIAMSGGYSGEAVPSGVPAEAFYEKGRSLGSLTHIVGAMTAHSVAC